ncbi:hypothetical protein SDC9_19508 [bioreactor metagenome]|uniref:Uncharacterized protein n=1 Tax=bioreactor metagenome TaxID=1076179 RepID=A0A644U452_9ZZZZ
MDLHAVKALETLGIADLSGLRDGAVAAADAAQLARRAAFRPPRDPAPQPQESAHPHRRAKRTERAAEALEPDHRNGKPAARPQHIGPGPVEMHGDRGLEGLDLGGGLGVFGRRDRHGDQRNERRRPGPEQRPRQACRWFHLRKVQQAPEMMGEFLKRAEGAQPAAEEAAPPEQKAEDRRGPDQQAEGIVEQHLEPARRHAADNRKERHHGQLTLPPESNEPNDKG